MPGRRASPPRVVASRTGRRPLRRLGLLAGLVVLASAASAPAADPVAAPGGNPPAGPAVGFATILTTDIAADLDALASAPLEGRDSPSAGLSLAAARIEQRMQAAGLQGAAKDGGFRWTWTRKLLAPVADACALEIVAPAEHAATLVLGTDFVPVIHTGGSAEGEAVFLGFGIDSDADKYDDIRGDLAGKVAVIVEGEPRHKKLFAGAEVSPVADLFAKLDALQEARLAGVLMVRRPPEPEAGARAAAPETKSSAPAAAGQPAAATFAFRSTWAEWSGELARHDKDHDFPVLEITPAAAQAIIGEDVLAIAAKVDRSAEPPRAVAGRRVKLSGRCAEAEVSLDNVVGIVKGSDPALAAEYVVVGAHYDHVGVDPRGRIGYGADDNASGTAAMLEVVTALAASPPRRSILACAFSAEEDGLLGSAALCKDPPVPKESLVAMLNMDMIGRGTVDEVAVLGLIENPALEKVLNRAKKLQNTKVRSLVLRQGEDLFSRSDQYSFHRIGVPTLFFFEGLPIEKNPDYHTWRDTIDRLDLDKIARTARLVYDTAWILATDDERPPAPGHDSTGK